MLSILKFCTQYMTYRIKYLVYNTPCTLFIQRILIRILTTGMHHPADQMRCQHKGIHIYTRTYIWHCTQNHNTSNPTLHHGDTHFLGSSASFLLSLKDPPCIRTGSPVSVILETVMPLAWYRTTSSRPDMKIAASPTISTMPILSTCARQSTNEDTVPKEQNVC